MTLDVVSWAAGTVFAVAFVLLAFGRIPGRAVQRGTVAVVAGALTLAILAPAGRLPWQAWRLVDWQVIGLLAGLMVLGSLAETAGLFAGLRRRLGRQAPWLALWLSLVVVALTSATILNDAAVVVLVPFLMPMLRRLGLPLVPCVALLAASANLGSLLTPFGNPQDAVLARHAHLGLADFLRVQGPLVALGLAVLVVPCRRLGRGVVTATDEPVHPLAARHRLWAAAGITAFVAGAVLVPEAMGTVAVACATGTLAVLCIWLPRDALAAARRGFDWNVILLFLGMYVLTAGLGAWFPSDRLAVASLTGPVRASVATVALSNAIGNVPAILTLRSLDPAWTVTHAAFLATTSTLGGALLLTGSAASLLAADVAKRLGTEVRFASFARHAAWLLPILLLGIWWTW